MTDVSQHDTEDTSIKRRRVLKLTGATVVGGTAAAGVASARPHAPEEVRFCGCTQVCVKRGEESDPFWVITAEDVDGDFVYDCQGPYEMDMCVEPGDKVIAIVDGALNVICNPNHCAAMVRDRTGGIRTVTCSGTSVGIGRDFDVSSCDCEPEREPGQHEYECRLPDSTGGMTTVTIRTNKCQPPWKWD